jgi:hypothetical protein
MSRSGWWQLATSRCVWLGTVVGVQNSGNDAEVHLALDMNIKFAYFVAMNRPVIPNPINLALVAVVHS